MRIPIRQDYRKCRAAGYPPVGEQLDAIWAYLASLPQDTLPQPVRDTLARIAAVKARYPSR